MRRPLILALLAEALAIALLLILLGSGTESAESESPGSAAASPASATGATTSDLTDAPDPAAVEAIERTEVRSTSTSNALGILVHGNVSEGDGTPVTEGAVSFINTDTAEVVTSVSVDSPGAYAITGLTPGNWSLHYRGDGYRELYDPVTIPSGTETHRRDVVVHKAALVQVRFLTPEGESLRELALARARTQGRPRWSSMYALATESPPRGHFPSNLLREVTGLGKWSSRQTARDLPAGYDGRLQLQIDPPAHVSAMLRNLVLATELVQPGQEELTFHISLEDIESLLATVRVRLLDAQTGEPVPGAEVTLMSRQGTQGSQVSDAEGNLTIAGAVPGLLILHVRSPEHEWLWKHVRIEPGDHDLGVLEISRGRVLNGTVVDAQGNPVQARIHWDHLGHRTFPQPLITNRIATANPEGKFSIERIGRGRYAVHASDREKGMAHALVDTGISPIPEVHLQLAPTHDVMVETNFGPFEVYTVTISTPEGLPVWANRLRSGPVSRISLPAGDYRVQIHSEVALVRSQSLTVGASPAKIIVP